MNRAELLDKRNELESQKNELKEQLRILANDVKKSADEKAEEERRIQNKINEINEELLKKSDELNTLTHDINNTIDGKVHLNEVMSYNDFLHAVNQLSHQFEALKEDGNRRNRNKGKTIFRRGEPLNKAGRKGLERVHKISDQRLDQLKAMKLQVTKANERDRKNPGMISNVSISETLVNNLRKAQGELANIEHDRELARGGEFSQTAHFPNNSPERVRDATRQKEKNLRFQNELNTALKNDAILQLFNNTQRKANEYLQDAIDGKWDIQQALFYQQNADRFESAFSKNTAGIPNHFMLANRCATEANRLCPPRSRASAQARTSYENQDRGETFEKE